MDDDTNRILMNLFEECYNEAYDALREDTRISSPFPPFQTIEFPDTFKLEKDLYEGNQWTLMPKMASWKSRPYKNIIFEVVEGQTTFLTDNSPAITILPRSQDDYPLSEMVSAAVDYWWDMANMDRKMMDVVKLSRIYGIGWLYLYWDSEKKEHKCKVIKPWDILVDPDTSTEDYEPSYLIYQFKTTVGELVNKFGVNPDVFRSEYQPGNAHIVTETMYDSTRPRSFERANYTLSRPTWCYQFWLKDTQAEEIEQDIGGGKVAVIRKKKYPNGRVITIAGGQVLSDMPSPYEHGQFPFIPYIAYPEPGKLFGASDVTNVMALQVYRNRTQQIYYDSLEKSMGALFLVNYHFFKGDRLSNDPVQIHEVSDVDRALRVIPTGNLTRHEVSLIDMFDSDIDDVSGMHDISRGANIAGNKTAQEVSIIAESDKTRTRAAARVVAWSNRILARQLLSNMAQFTDYEWFIRISGQTDNEGNSLDETPIAFNGTMMKRTDEMGRLTKENVEFDIRVDDYSMLPASQRDKSQLYTMLYQMVPGFPLEEFLKGVGLPNAKAIAMKVEQAQQEQAQAQAPGQQQEQQQEQPQEQELAPEQMPEEELGTQDESMIIQQMMQDPQIQALLQQAMG
jgi:hypothetical protein